MARLERGAGSLDIPCGSAKSVCGKMCQNFYLGHMFSSQFLQRGLQVSKGLQRVQGSRDPLWVHSKTIPGHAQGWEPSWDAADPKLCTPVT